MPNKGKLSVTAMMSPGRRLERESGPAAAIEQYLALIKKFPLHIDAYTRLMILYRKQKEYRKELLLINKAIKIYKKSIADQQREWIREHREMAKISKPLAISLGLVDINGLPVHEDEVLDMWKRRRELVAKKLKALGLLF